MQKVDPFIPVTNRQRPTIPRTVRKSPPVRGRSLDGLAPVARHKPTVHRDALPALRPHPLLTQRPEPAAPPPPTAPAQPHRDAFKKAEQAMTAPPKARRPIWKMASTILQITLLLILFAFGFLLRSLIVGQAIIILYAIFAFVFRVESRTTFIFVLISFGVVLISSLRSDTALASVFAVYAFLLLIVATISLGREIRAEV